MVRRIKAVGFPASAAELKQHRSPPTEIIFFANPISGSGRGTAVAEAVAARVQHDAAELRRAEGDGDGGKLKVAVFVTTRAGEAGDIISTLHRDVAAASAGSAVGTSLLVVVCGGDGTVSEVINAAVRRADSAAFLQQTAFAVLPTGTGNGESPGARFVLVR
jgi:diacylglycerol kinase family enzyme